MTESICTTCRHFRQTQPLPFLVSGYCGWEPSEPLPPWLSSYVGSTDQYYGPRRDVGRGAYGVRDCAAHSPADAATIARRRSED